MNLAVGNGAKTKGKRNDFFSNMHLDSIHIHFASQAPPEGSASDLSFSVRVPLAQSPSPRLMSGTCSRTRRAGGRAARAVSQLLA